MPIELSNQLCCPICEEIISSNNVQWHMKNRHGIQLISKFAFFRQCVCGFMTDNSAALRNHHVDNIETCVTYAKLLGDSTDAKNKKMPDM